jgi:hypothetical protein
MPVDLPLVRLFCPRNKAIITLNLANKVGPLGIG